MEKVKQRLKALWQDRKKRTVLCIALSVAALILILVLALLLIPTGEGNVPAFAPGERETDAATETVSAGENITLTETVTAPAEPLEPNTSAETLDPQPPTVYAPQVMAEGIDVSKWQGSIDWQAVKSAGVDFAMIRLGYCEGGEMKMDEYAVYNLQQAEKHGILCGVYFFSGADSPQEAREEAKWVLDQLSGFAISYPVVLDSELGGTSSSVSAAVRTDAALSFLLEVERGGYEAMLYAPMAEFENPAIWEADRILSQCPVWVARYSQVAYPELAYPATSFHYAMWQYTDKGSIPGIEGDVDRNVSYFSREYKPPKDPAARPAEVILPEEFENQTFSSLSCQMTAKEVVNLRKKPSIEGEIVGELKNGEWLLCTGKSNLGWARLEYNGQHVYAIYSYLTTDTP